MIRLRWLALWLLLLGALAAWTALRVGQDQTVRSDLLALLPRASEAAPVQPALEHLAASGANRAFLLVTAPNLPQAVSGVDEAVPSLVASGAFAKVIAKMPPPQGKEVLAFFRNAAPCSRRPRLRPTSAVFSSNEVTGLSPRPARSASPRIRSASLPTTSAPCLGRRPRSRGKKAILPRKRRGAPRSSSSWSFAATRPNTRRNWRWRKRSIKLNPDSVNGIRTPR